MKMLIIAKRMGIAKSIGEQMDNAIIMAWEIYYCNKYKA